MFLMTAITWIHGNRTLWIMGCLQHYCMHCIALAAYMQSNPIEGPALQCIQCIAGKYWSVNNCSALTSPTIGGGRETMSKGPNASPESTERQIIIQYYGFVWMSAYLQRYPGRSHVQRPPSNLLSAQGIYQPSRLTCYACRTYLYSFVIVFALCICICVCMLD